MTQLQAKDPNDRDLEQLFRTARRADTREAPKFRVPAIDRHPPVRRPVSFFRVAGATIGACFLAVVVSSPFVLNHVLDSFEAVEEPTSVGILLGAAPRPAPALPPPMPAAPPAIAAPSAPVVAAHQSAGTSTKPHTRQAVDPAGDTEPKQETFATDAVLSDERLTARESVGGEVSGVYGAVPAEVVGYLLEQSAPEVVAQSDALPPRPPAPRPMPEAHAVRAKSSDGLRHDIPEREPYRDTRREEFHTESYRAVEESPFRKVEDHPLSTFSADVDTASYTNVRRFLREGRLPPADAVRVEEIVNYFRYDYPLPARGEVFSTDLELADCPWNDAHRLVRIGIRAKAVERGDLAGSNLVFLVDVSGSMDEPDKLPLLKQGLRMLARGLDGRDRVAMVVYAGSSGLVLPPTPGSARGEIFAAIEKLEAGGSTNGGAGIALAYHIAVENLLPGGVNRVILATDGDFNVGVSSHSELIGLIRQGATQGVFLSVLGFGTGNLDDGRLERLADEGNGHYAYIDSIDEARRVLVDQVDGTLVTVAKDVKFQVEFNPEAVSAYRLIGYENRALAKEDFNDDMKDAGEVGSGHTVTALYELVPAGMEIGGPAVDPLRYQRPLWPSKDRGTNGELLTLKIRYKEPDRNRSELREVHLLDPGGRLVDASEDFRLASAAALFGMLLRGSPHVEGADIYRVRALLVGAPKEGAGERQAELLGLVEAAAPLMVPNER